MGVAKISWLFMHYWPKNIHRAFSAYSKNYLLEPNTNSSHIFTIWIGKIRPQPKSNSQLHVPMTLSYLARISYLCEQIYRFKTNNNGYLDEFYSRTAVFQWIFWCQEEQNEVNKARTERDTAHGESYIRSTLYSAMPLVLPIDVWLPVNKGCKEPPIGNGGSFCWGRDWVSLIIVIPVFG